MSSGSRVSAGLFERSSRVVPGGVNSPVRAWSAVGGEPVFVGRGEGSRIFDEDGRGYLDYVCAWGPLILGHAPPAVVEAVVNAVPEGMGFGAPTRKELELAELVSERIAGIEQLRLVNSGTEATMSAIRLSRGYTGRNKVLKFDGCYHGHVDALLAKAGSGVASFSLPDSAGIPESFTGQTLIAGFNDVASVRSLIQENHQDLAAVIVEPVCGNMGVIPPEPGFLEALRELTRRYGIVLIFDEVITGFRVAPGGAQQRYGVTPDLTCLGKILGGGLPVGAFGGRRDIMSCLAPVGPVYQAGHPFGKSGDGHRRFGHSEGPGGAGRVPGIGGEGAEAGGGVEGRARPRGPGHGEPGGLHADAVSGARTGHRTGPCASLRPGPLRALLSRHAGAGDLPSALALRGAVPVAGPQRQRHRRHRDGGCRLGG